MTKEGEEGKYGGVKQREKCNGVEWMCRKVKRKGSEKGKGRTCKLGQKRARNRQDMKTINSRCVQSIKYR